MQIETPTMRKEEAPAKLPPITSIGSIIVIALVLSFIHNTRSIWPSTSSRDEVASWKTFELKEHDFSIKLPNPPNQIKTTTTSTAQKNVSFVRYYSSSSASSFAIQIALTADVVSTPLNELFGDSLVMKDIQETRIFGNEALNFSTTMGFNGNDVEVRGQIIRAKKFTYMLMAFQSSDREYKQFIDSFRIVTK